MEIIMSVWSFISGTQEDVGGNFQPKNANVDVWY